MKLADTVRVVEIDGELVILDLSSGSYFGVNKVGSRVVEMLRQGEGVSRIVEALYDEYSDAELEQVEQDVSTFIRRLKEKGLVAE